MNSAHLHLMLNHVPVIGLLAGILLLVLSLIRKSGELNKLCLWTFIIVALTAIPVYITGEPSEDIVEGIAGVSETVMEQHEKMASITLAAIVVLGIIATGGLFFFRNSAAVPARFLAIPLIVSIIAGGLTGNTARLGGQIRHSEIRKDFQASSSDGRITEKDHEEEDDD